MAHEGRSPFELGKENVWRPKPVFLEMDPKRNLDASCVAETPFSGTVSPTTSAAQVKSMLRASVQGGQGPYSASKESYKQQYSPCRRTSIALSPIVVKEKFEAESPSFLASNLQHTLYQNEEPSFGVGNTPIQETRFSLTKQPQLLTADKPPSDAESLNRQKRTEERSPSVNDSFSPLRKAVLSSEKKKKQGSKKGENNGEVHKQHLVQTFSALKVIP